MSDLLVENLLNTVRILLEQIKPQPLERRVEVLNALRRLVHEYSPFQDEPVDCVEWVPAQTVQANDYNPNGVAPPEMRLLRLSVMTDGYTQPIVVMGEEGGEGDLVIVDGFHRSRVGKESVPIRRRLHGYLPVTRIRAERSGLGDRMAATIRHIRARGLHAVKPLSAVVAELAALGWADERIAKELGMEPDEVLRLKQITGLAALFQDRAFSRAWE